MKPIVAATPDQVRETLRLLADEHRVTLSSLSRMVRRPPDYLARFVRGAGPNGLPASEVQLLAKYFRVDPQIFGAREYWNL